MKPIAATAATAVLALILGFAIGWIAKPVPQTLALAPNTSPTPRPPAKTPPAKTPPSTLTPSRDLPTPDPSTPPGTFTNGSPPPTSDKLDQAKWLRLFEVLNLNTAQTEQLRNAISTTTSLLDTEPDTLTAFQTAGEQLEKRIREILSPEQRTAYDQLTQRKLDNHLESTSQLALKTELGSIDLTPQQREQALSILRTESETQYQLIPESTRLLLSPSILPLERQSLEPEGLLLLQKLRPDEDPAAAFQNMLDQHRAEIERKKTLFQNILTPAQNAAYRAQLEEYQRNIEIISPGP